MAAGFLETRGSCTLILRGLPPESWRHSPGASWSPGGPGKHRDCFGKSAGGVILLARFPGTSSGPPAQSWLGVGLMIPGRPLPTLGAVCTFVHGPKHQEAPPNVLPLQSTPPQLYTHIVAKTLLPLPGPSNAPLSSNLPQITSEPSCVFW